MLRFNLIKIHCCDPSKVNNFSELCSSVEKFDVIIPTYYYCNTMEIFELDDGDRLFINVGIPLGFTKSNIKKYLDFVKSLFKNIDVKKLIFADILPDYNFYINVEKIPKLGIFESESK